MSELFNFITKKNITDEVKKEEKKKPTVFYYIKEI